MLTTADPVALKLANHGIKEGHSIAVPPYKMVVYYFPCLRSEELAHPEFGLAKNAMLVLDIRDTDWESSVLVAQRGLDTRFLRPIG